MKNKKIITVALLLSVICITKAQAQQTIVTTGGNASGSTGNVAYSGGQIFTIKSIGSNGSIVQGVQHPYELSVVLGLEDHSINLKLSAYPNPTANFLELKVESKKLEDLSFLLFDISGNVLISRKMVNSTETIGMENLPSGTYILKVVKNNEEVKTFKIIKK